MPSDSVALFNSLQSRAGGKHWWLLVCILVRSKVVASVMELMELYLEAWIFLWTCVCFSYEQVVVDSTESTTFELPLRLRLYIHGIQFSNHN